MSGRARYEGWDTAWLRWVDGEGIPIPTGHERAEAERQRAEAESCADAERQLAESERQAPMPNGSAPMPNGSAPTGLPHNCGSLASNRRSRLGCATTHNMVNKSHQESR